MNVRLVSYLHQKMKDAFCLHCEVEDLVDCENCYRKFNSWQLSKNIPENMAKEIEEILSEGA